MKVIDLKTKKEIDVNESYASRLIEQGKAVLPPTKAKAEPAEKKSSKGE